MGSCLLGYIFRRPGGAVCAAGDRGKFKGMSLLNFGGRYRLSSGRESPLKIDCECLSEDDWQSLCDLALYFLSPFRTVEGVPTGGTYLADLLSGYWEPQGGLLIVDDVLSTGASMERQRAGRKAQGFVVFARNKPPDWVRALFIMPEDI